MRGYGFEISERFTEHGLHRTVSVPLRGYGFEISERFSEHGLHRTVSVPLRGYGFEMPTQNKSSLYYVYGFPSPCGDMVLKSPLIRKELVVYCEFPSPCGDMVLK